MKSVNSHISEGLQKSSPPIEKGRTGGIYEPSISTLNDQGRRFKGIHGDGENKCPLFEGELQVVEIGELFFQIDL